jgi:hypothetical protein
VTLYTANDGKTYSEQESWFWPVDEARNVLVKPETLRFTDDTFKAFATAVGYRHLLRDD